MNRVGVLGELNEKDLRAKEMPLAESRRGVGMG
jgi:hypothetical protein